MKRCEQENKEWEMQPFILDIITPYLKDSVLEYMDFIQWHCTCKTVWRHLEPCLYDAYLVSFVESCTLRNHALYKKLPSAEIYRRLHLLSVITVVCEKIKNIVPLLTSITNFDYAELKIRNVVFPDLKQGNTLSVKHIDVLNLIAQYIKEKYGWRFVIFRASSPSNPLPTPLKTGVSYDAKDLGYTLVPGLRQPFMPMYYSIMSIRNSGK